MDDGPWDREISGLDLGAYLHTHRLEDLERPDRCLANIGGSWTGQ